MSLDARKCAELLAIRERATPGPWRFEVRPKDKVVYLQGGRPQYDLSVMDFVRWGMSGAAPRFRDVREQGLNLMTGISVFTVPCPGREHHTWLKLVDHPDAQLIEHAHDLADALRDALEVLRQVKALFDAKPATEMTEQEASLHNKLLDAGI